MYVYQADTYCDSCGERIRADLDKYDAYSTDSDEYPKYAPDDQEVDYPDHCASGGDCLESIDLLAYGLPTVAFAPVLVGAETQRIGALLSDNLTPDGVSYLREMIEVDESTLTPYQRALHSYWREVFADYLPAPPTYVVIENTPGYLPEDDDPATFDNIEDARVYASDRLSSLLDSIYEGQMSLATEMGETPGFEVVGSFQSDDSVIVYDKSRTHDLGRVISIVKEEN